MKPGTAGESRLSTRRAAIGSYTNNAGILIKTCECQSMVMLIMISLRTVGNSSPYVMRQPVLDEILVLILISAHKYCPVTLARFSSNGSEE